METKRIFTNNAAYQRFTAIKSNRNKRLKYNEFFVEGVRNINEAVRNEWKIKSFLYTKEKPLSNWAVNLLASTATDINYELTAELMDGLSGKQDTSELLAVTEIKRTSAANLENCENPVFALFDRPSNKGNLGSVIRSCDALGVSGLIITGHCVDVYDPDVISASMGSFFKIPTIKMSDTAEIGFLFDRLKTIYPGLKIVGTTAHGLTDISDIDMTMPVLLLIGNETDGLNRFYLNNSDVLAAIPMSGSSSASSFNVACAATVVFYEVSRQRRAKGNA